MNLNLDELTSVESAIDQWGKKKEDGFYDDVPNENVEKLGLNVDENEELN